MKKNILLLCGGGGTEHEISIVSSSYIEKTLNEMNLYNVIKVEIGKDKIFRRFNPINQLNEVVEINFSKELIGKTKERLHFVIPCIHGPPGETGEIQTYFDLIGLPYLGCGPEASIISFNKITSKLWFSALGIPNTPFCFITSIEDKLIAFDFLKKHKKIFIKAASQGSSVGCFQVFEESTLEEKLKEAFTYSNYVLIEKMVSARELEISVYEYDNQIIATVPGEIICPSKFYSYEEKYNPQSKTLTKVVASELSRDLISDMQMHAIKVFKNLKLRHLSRIDFFFTDENELFLNEINTFPGMTPISMFPKMLENHGHSFSKFLQEVIENNIL